MKKDPKLGPSWISSLVAGSFAVGAGLLALIIYHLPLSIKWRALIFVLYILFVTVLIWHRSVTQWEFFAKRRTVAILQYLGTLLIVKSVASQVFPITSTDANLLFEQENQTAIALKLFVAMASTPWPFDLGIAVLGFAMLLSTVLLISKSYKNNHNVETADFKKAQGRSHPSKSCEMLDQEGRISKEKQPLKFFIIDTYDSDLPPLIDTWVGRESELELLKDVKNGVIAITGIGGQGKSTLAAKALEIYRNEYPDGIWNWRDCREESDRFRTQLISVIEYYSMGEVSAEQVSDQNTSWLAKYFFQKIGSQNGFIVFDNVDYYVNVDSSQFTSDVSAFVQESLRVDHNFLIIFTCRPRISYPSVRFREIYLRGLELDETIELFRIKVPGESKPEHEELLKRFHSITDGHPFWLTIIFSQIGRKPAIQLSILKQLEAGGVDDRTNAMLRGVWAGLNDDQKSILKYMAELPRAMESGRVFEYMDKAVCNYNRFSRAFRTLKTICLIIEKGEGGANANRFELHPIVRAFIRREYHDRTERSQVLGTLLICCDQIVVRLKDKNTERLSIEMLEPLITKVEFQIALDEIEEAIVTLIDISDDLIARGIHEEFIRLAKIVVSKTNWSDSNWIADEKFDTLIQSLAHIMVEIGQMEDLRPIMNNYESTVSHGTARYIGLCDLFAYIEWFQKDFPAAIDWGQRGVDLKRTSGLDTSHDSSHILALAQRDSGEVDKALKYLCLGEELKSIIADNHRTSDRRPHFYGNIGRCLALKGDTNSALCLYAKSYDILIQKKDSLSLLNTGYAAFWIGEALEDIEQWEDSYLFYQRAVSIWNRRSPRRSEEPNAKLLKLSSFIGDTYRSFTSIQVENMCKEWVTNCLKEIP